MPAKFKIRDSGEGSRPRYTVVISKISDTLFYAFPENTNENYRYIGSLSEGIHENNNMGEEIDIERLPEKWANIVSQLITDLD